MVCPKCNKKIDYVYCVFVGSNIYTLNNKNELELTDSDSSEDDEYTCPECKNHLTYDECIKALKD